MKKWLLAAAVCVLTACSSGGESKTYLSATGSAGRRAERRQSGARLLWVEQVTASRIIWRVTGWSIRPPTCSM